MKIVVVADDKQWNALTEGHAAIQWVRAAADFSFKHYADAGAFFILHQDTTYNYAETLKPVFINNVTATLKELNTPPQVLRINGWPGFLQRPVWEIAGTIDDTITTIAEKINKKLVAVKDEAGLVAATVVAMIINEAYFALGDGVSTKAEIDIAMKLGTNYPYGPFEWAEKIGIKNIFSLLQKLSLHNKRYQPAPALVNAIQNY